MLLSYPIYKSSENDILLLMQQFKNIVGVIDSQSMDDMVITQSCAIADQNNARLTFIIVTPSLAKELKDIEEAYQDTIKNLIQDKLNDSNFKAKPTLIFKNDKRLTVSIIKTVIEEKSDLLIKSADGEHNLKGFESLDMGLMRKCPCPVWICRKDMGAQPNILMAVDPFADTKEGQDLNIKVLETGQSMASALNSKAIVMSCWDFECEHMLRHSGYLKVSSEKLDELLKKAENDHKNALNDLLAKTHIKDNTVVIEKGAAHEIIPEFVDDNDIDILVMGTVARTGIPGFIIGNTAENILQKVSSGMLALKPDGFKSPVR